MNILKIVGIGFVATILSALLKRQKPEISTQISIIAVAVIFFIVAPYLKTVISMLSNLTEELGVDIEYIEIIIKVIGIAYVTQIGAEICRDSGESAIATKIELAGKVIIMTFSMPIIYRLLGVISNIINTY